jgi:hypothetical protein
MPKRRCNFVCRLFQLQCRRAGSVPTVCICDTTPKLWRRSTRDQALSERAERRILSVYLALSQPFRRARSGSLVLLDLRLALLLCCFSRFPRSTRYAQRIPHHHISAWPLSLVCSQRFGFPNPADNVYEWIETYPKGRNFMRRYGVPCEFVSAKPNRLAWSDAGAFVAPNRQRKGEIHAFTAEYRMTLGAAPSRFAPKMMSAEWKALSPSSVPSAGACA